MNKEQKKGLREIVDELTSIKYELSLYVDDGLIELGESFENAINKLIHVTGTSASGPVRRRRKATLRNHSALTKMADTSDLPTPSLNQPENNETAFAKTVLLDKVFSRTSEVQPFLRQEEGETEIINLSSLSRETLEALFPSEHPAPKETAEENEESGR